MRFKGSLNAFLIITGVVILATSLPIGAATRCVNSGGTGGCYSSIQRAIDAAAPGDTILIGKGIYTENVVVTKR
jgi:pectin methylesterase-like acyl-CoA thioesterase